MYHTVFHIGELVLDAVMNIFCDFMRLKESYTAVTTDLNIHIYLIPKHPGFHIIDGMNSFHCHDRMPHLLRQPGIAGLIRQFSHRIPEYIKSCFQNKSTDNDTGDGIKYRKTKLCPQDTDKTTDG